MEKCVKTNKIEWIWEDGYKIMLGLRRVATGSVVQRLSKLAIVSLNRTFGTHAELRHILENWRRKRKENPKEEEKNTPRKQHGRLALKAGTNKHHQNLILNSHLWSLYRLSTLHNHLATSHGIKCPSYQIIGGPMCLCPVHSPCAPIFARHLFLSFLSYSFTNYLHIFLTVEMTR